MITQDILEGLAKNTPPGKLKAVGDAIRGVCPLYPGLYDRDVMPEFLATLLEESGEFKHYTENLSYSAARLCVVWPKRFKTLTDAAPYEHNPQKLAEKVYGMRADLGNTQPGDGWLFRGSGPIQITGRGLFTAFTKFMEDHFLTPKTPEQWADLVRTNETAAMHSACWVFAISKKLIDEAENDLFMTITKRINGGLTNYPTRVKYYEAVKAALA